MSDAIISQHYRETNKLDVRVSGNAYPSPLALLDRLVLSDSDSMSFGSPDYRAQYIFWVISQN